jgi:peptidoglycan/xylan/chitin deacetylase (PgdA/CDA1 family)
MYAAPRYDDDNKIRALLIVGGDARRVVLLAEQIERHLPEAEICGIIYKVPASSQFEIAKRIRNGLGSLGTAISRLTFGLIHGGRTQQAEPSGPKDLLSKKCRKTGWRLCFAQDLTTLEVLEFARQTKADLGLTVGITAVPSALASLSKMGTIQGEIFSGDNEGSRTAPTDNLGTNVPPIEVRVKIVRVASGDNDSLLATVELFRQPLDTDVSLELKSNLILRDLLVQSVTALVRHPEEASARIDSWIQNMIPYSFTRAEAFAGSAVVDQTPPLRVRSRSKLWLYSVLLLSPFVTLRNWLRRLRKQQPVIFLNSHLISDRHHRMALPTEAFLREIQFLQKHYRIVRLSEAIRLLKTGAVTEPTVVLTFDDGYEDNFLTLRAISEEMGVPIVMFISTEPVTEHREFPHDLERGLTGFRALSWDQIRYWSADGTEFHSHTCSHFDCGSADEEVLEKEIVESKRVLEGRLENLVTSFAFPFGKSKNMSAAAVAIAGKTYDHFLSSFGGENFPSESESHKHLLRKHLQGNSWETELELQDVFGIAKSLKQFAKLGPKTSAPTRLEAKDNSNVGEAHEHGS